MIIPTLLPTLIQVTIFAAIGIAIYSYIKFMNKIFIYSVMSVLLFICVFTVLATKRYNESSFEYFDNLGIPVYEHKIGGNVIYSTDSIVTFEKQYNNNIINVRIDSVYVLINN